jgi:nucleotide-binding universal stress UspA family protein
VTYVLAAADLTPLGRRVADRARLVAEQFGLDIRLIHAIEPMAEAFITDELAKLVGAHEKEAAERLAEWLRGRTELDVSVTTVKGSAAWEISRLSKEAALTLIGSSAVDYGRVGPVARLVTEASRGDVVVVRRQPRNPYRRVLVPVDLSEASVRGVELARRLAPEATLSRLYALPTRFDSLMAEAGMFPEEIDLNRKGRLSQARQALDDFASRFENVSTTVVDGPPLEVIEETARRRSADLTVVASRGAGATRMVLLGTVASGVLDTLPCDVAIARVPGDFRRP